MIDGAMILEGGAVRGVFTSGALDFLMEQECYLSHVIGVSAGSCNAVNYVSGQKERTRDCIIRGEEDGKLINIRKIWKNKSLFDMDLLFDIDPREIHPFDYDAYVASDMICDIVVTNCLSGKAEYLREKDDWERLMRLLRASSSMPLASPMVEIDGVPYLDGGISDSVPLLYSLKCGNRKNVIILTRGKGYRKTCSKKTMAAYQIALKKYPKLAEALCLRARRYNKTMDCIEKWEEEGKIFVVRPQDKTVSRTESRPEVLMEFYKHGFEQMKAQYENMLRFLES